MVSKKPILGDLEIEIMKVLWEHHDVAVQDVVVALSPKRKLHHNTVMTVLNRLCKKNYVRRYPRDGRSYTYEALLTKDEVSHEYLNLVSDLFFDGSISQTISAFLGAQKKTNKKNLKIEKLLKELTDDS